VGWGVGVWGGLGLVGVGLVQVGMHRRAGLRGKEV
jgi:hypothetical protein